MSEEQDDSSKTEEPSHKKLEEARKRGQTVSSREINHFFMMLALTFFIIVLTPKMGRDAVEMLGPYITKPDEIEIDPVSFGGLMRQVVYILISLLAIPFALSIAAALAPPTIQGKWVFATDQIKPKLEKLSLLKGFNRLFGWKAIIEFLKNLLKVTIVGTAAVMVVLPYRNQLDKLPMLPRNEMLDYAKLLAGKMMISACIILFLISLLDYFYQRFIFMKSMRMSRQEMKDEYKQQEGDPHVKQKLKQIRREKARKRMMANVPKADVVITNPTHYAVALQYDAATMPAPVVLAKGSDDVALRIRDLATKSKVPIVRNPPLARVLYDTTDIDEEIPVQHYQAVAKIIGYVYKLKGKVPPSPGKGASGGGKGAKPVLHMKK